LTAESWPYEDPNDFDDVTGQLRTIQLLRFEAGGRPFARIFSGTGVKLELPVALASAGGTLTLDAKGVVVRGHLEAMEMPLYPASAFAMSGVLVPNHQRRIIWRAAKPGVMVVAAGPIPRLRAVGREFSAERDCKDVAIGHRNVDDDAIDKVMKAERPYAEPSRPWPWLRSGKATLSAEPEGDVVAEIDVIEPRDDTLLIHPPRVLRAKKGQTRIALRTYGGVVFGWVPNSQIERSTRQYLDLSHDNSIYLTRAIVPEGAYVTCRRDMPLVAEVGGERRLVGTVRAGTHFDRAETRQGWTEVRLHNVGIATEEGASFLLREADIAECVSVPSR